jgi:hypothetical protein
MFFGLSSASLFFSLRWLQESAFISIQLLYDAEGTGNITSAHGRKAQSNIESILLANQDEWHKIVAIEIIQDQLRAAISQAIFELPDRRHRRFCRRI